MFWTTFLLLKNIKLLIIRYLKNRFGKLYFFMVSKTINLFFFNMLWCCARRVRWICAFCAFSPSLFSLMMISSLFLILCQSGFALIVECSTDGGAEF